VCVKVSTISVGGNCCQIIDPTGDFSGPRQAMRNIQNFLEGKKQQGVSKITRPAFVLHRRLIIIIKVIIIIIT
jgi:hypothetical protein